MKSINEYITRRNDIALRAERSSEEIGNLAWTKLGPANRHISRVVAGEMEFVPAVADEIEANLAATDEWLTRQEQA